MKKIAIITVVVIALLVGAFYYFGRNIAGGGGSTQTAPDSVLAGQPALIDLELSVSGDGGPIKGRYSGVVLNYRLAGETDYKRLTADPIPIIFSGEQASFNNKYEAYTFNVPPYPKGTSGEIEFNFEFKLDGHFSRVEGVKKIKIIP